ncbi:hypothetical protein [Cohaesibacter sp. ES.047]|uniref:hypothetical protein n=1 Tax=Cohaesibacter sp. ES.047 TaxID=1798205 RepID=UPI000BB86E1C|nr:hypothetical protein [Cohaesibacter sp. ES.047]
MNRRNNMTDGRKTIGDNSFYYDLTRRITHDLKAPIRQISQLSEIILEDNADKLDEESLKSLIMMRERASTMAHLVNSVRSLSNAFLRELNMQQIELDCLLEEIEIDSKLPPNLLKIDNAPSIWTDPELFSIFFYNLFQNFFLPLGSGQIENASLKLNEDVHSSLGLMLRIPDFPLEIPNKMSLLELSTFARGDLLQSLAIIESSQLADRLGWKIFLHTNNNNELSMNLYL